MDKTNILTAEEARKISEESTCQINRVFKEIKNSAKENNHYIDWCTYSMNEVALTKLIITLQDNGYKIKINKEDLENQDLITSLTIVW